MKTIFLPVRSSFFSEIQMFASQIQVVPSIPMLFFEILYSPSWHPAFRWGSAQHDGTTWRRSSSRRQPPFPANAIETSAARRWCDGFPEMGLPQARCCWFISIGKSQSKIDDKNMGTPMDWKAPFRGLKHVGPFVGDLPEMSALCHTLHISHNHRLCRRWPWFSPIIKSIDGLFIPYHIYWVDLY